MRNKKEYKPVQSIERIFQIMEILALNPDGLSLLSLSEKTGLPSSTVHRLLHTLYALGYTEWRTTNSKPYKLTLRLFEYGNYSLQNRPFIKAVYPFLERLSKELSASISLYVPEGNDVVVVLKTDPYPFSQEMSVGARIPMYCCSAGKSILSRLSQKEALQCWDESKIVPYTPNTIQQREQFLAALREDRKNGFSISIEEYRIGLCSLSVPITNPAGSPIASISIVCPVVQFSTVHTDNWKKVLKQYAQSIENLQFETV